MHLSNSIINMYIAIQVLSNAMNTVGKLMFLKVRIMSGGHLPTSGVLNRSLIDKAKVINNNVNSLLNEIKKAILTV